MSSIRQVCNYILYTISTSNVKFTDHEGRIWSYIQIPNSRPTQLMLNDLYGDRYVKVQFDEKAHAVTIDLVPGIDNMPPITHPWKIEIRFADPTYHDEAFVQFRSKIKNDDGMGVKKNPDDDFISFPIEIKPGFEWLETLDSMASEFILPSDDNLNGWRI